MEKLVHEFEATDADGNVYSLRVYQKFIDVSTSQNVGAVVPGMKRIVTDDGMAVNRLSEGEYEVVVTGVVLHADAPDAP